MSQPAGKVAFITGGSSGIGLGIARAFVGAGMKVVLGYRTQANLDEAMQTFGSARDRVHAIKVDVTDRPAMEAAAAETEQVFGKVHVIVNNAGVSVPTTIADATYDDWDWVMRVNVEGVYNGVHAFLPYIRKHGEGGQVIATSSTLGLCAVGSLGAYSASKFAVVGLMEALRTELAQTNIGASVFCPGPVNSRVADSGRNRPRDMSATGYKPDPAALARAREAVKKPEVAMDPLEAGRAVLNGMRANDLYILSHAEWAPMLEVRQAALMASVPPATPASQARAAPIAAMASNSVYARERDRKRCTTRPRT